MFIDQNNYLEILKLLNERKVQLVAVSKTKTVEAIKELYDLGHRDFGENYVQELIEKQQQLPPDIRWHFIGHLQTNKVKYIAPFVHLIHGVESIKVLKEINKQAVKHNRKIPVLLQVFIAKEETKFGLDENELYKLLQLFDLSGLNNVIIKGLMGIASLTSNEQLLREEFKHLKLVFDKISNNNIANKSITILSMGMSNDFKIALQEGTTMVRIGSLLFGERIPK